MYNENPKDYNPGMHTTEHILNQTMVRLFGCGRAFSAHIEKKKSKCDYHFDRDLTKEEVEKIESQVNAVIESRLPVTESFMHIGDAQKMFNLSRLPEEAGETIRVIKVGDYAAHNDVDKPVYFEAGYPFSIGESEISIFAGVGKGKEKSDLYGLENDKI